MTAIITLRITQCMFTILTVRLFTTIYFNYRLVRSNSMIMFSNTFENHCLYKKATQLSYKSMLNNINFAEKAFGPNLKKEIILQKCI